MVVLAVWVVWGQTELAPLPAQSVVLVVLVVYLVKVVKQMLEVWLGTLA